MKAPVIYTTTLATGVTLVLLYWVLAGLEVGKIGAPTDIGGGAILLAAYALSLVGAVGILVSWLDRRRRS